MKIQILGLPTTEGLETLNIPGASYGGGWVEGLIDGLLALKDSDIFIELIFFRSDIKRMTKKQKGRCAYRAIPAFKKNMKDFSKSLKRDLSIAYNEFQPDLVHIIGSERTSGRIMVDIINNRVPIVLSITGLISYCGRHFYSNLTEKDCRVKSLGDFLRGRGIVQQKKLFDELGKYERELFERVDVVIGRTEWDKACAFQLNPQVKYYHCAEVLRSAFYGKKWEFDFCEKYSIFISQASYSIKGLHGALEAIDIVRRKYPEVKLYIAGEDITSQKSFRDRLRMSSYGKLIKRKIKKFKLEKNIVFIGFLNAEAMAHRMKRANVFILPSNIENSPNSLAEAMLLGVPSVASYVGGIPDMLTHSKEGFLYPLDEPYMLAHYIDKIFAEKKTAEFISKNAKKRAETVHSIKNIGEELMGIYCDFIYDEKK